MLATLAIICGALTVWAIFSMETGNPTAINGVIGAGMLTVIFGIFAWMERR